MRAWTCAHRPLNLQIEGPRGASLLRDSIRDAQFRHIKRSCSILINNEIVCGPSLLRELF